MGWKDILKKIKLAEVKADQAGVINVKVENRTYNFNFPFADVDKVSAFQRRKIIPAVEKAVQEEVMERLDSVREILDLVSDSTAIEMISAASISSALTITCGLGSFRPVYPDGPNDLIGVHYRFKVVENQSQSLRIIFGSNRLYAPGSPITYLIESNVYSGRLRYTDGGCTTWPLLGTYVEGESSMRNAIADYPYHFSQQNGITTGINSSDPTNYPIQTYNVDNIANPRPLYKSDAISQFDINGIEALVTIERGATLTDVSAFARCGRSLSPATYRKWTMTTEMSGHASVVNEFVAPDSSARYLTVNEAMTFSSEFLHQPGAFTVQFWDFASIRESDPVWRALSNFTTTDRYGGNGHDFGIYVVSADGQSRIEFSNVPGNTYLGKNVVFSF